MPLPLLVPILVAASGALGIGKGAQAYLRSKEAKTIDFSAKELIEKMEKELVYRRSRCNMSLESLGQRKVDALRLEVASFVESYGKLKNVTLSGEGNIDSLTDSDFSITQLNEMQHSCSLAQASALGLGTGAAGGALTAFGAYSGTMMLASAGTGTAISTLGGAAATNATLAWLGGGTLASGGLGMAGGTMVLGVLAVGPALLVFGSLLSAKAGKNLENAKSNREQAKAYAEEVQLIATKLNGIHDLSWLASKTLDEARRQLQAAVIRMKNIIVDNGVDFLKFDQASREMVFKAAKIAQLTKSLVDTSILDEEGNLIGDNEANINGLAERLAILHV